MIRLLSSFALVVFFALAGCNSGKVLTDQRVEVGCGMCQLDRNDTTCEWAGRFDGKNVLIKGDVVPKDQESHAPDGMCNVVRDAIVSGTLYETHFAATKFELEPVEPAASPRFSPDDVH